MLVEEPDNQIIKDYWYFYISPNNFYQVNNQLCGAPAAIVTCVGGGGLAMGIIQVGTDSWSGWVIT